VKPARRKFQKIDIGEDFALVNVEENGTQF